jgi:hypothetical protein
LYKALVEGEHLLAEGRCYEKPLSVGDVFRQAYQLVPDRPVKEPGWQFVVSDFRRIDLRIEEIILYGHTVDTLEPGYTARLVLSGSGRDQIRSNHYDVLGVELQETDPSSGERSAS